MRCSAASAVSVAFERFVFFFFLRFLFSVLSFHVMRLLYVFIVETCMLLFLQLPVSMYSVQLDNIV